MAPSKALLRFPRSCRLHPRPSLQRQPFPQSATRWPTPPPATAFSPRRAPGTSKILNSRKGCLHPAESARPHFPLLVRALSDLCPKTMSITATALPSAGTPAPPPTRRDEICGSLGYSSFPSALAPRWPPLLHDAYMSHTSRWPLSADQLQSDTGPEKTPVRVFR